MGSLNATGVKYGGPEGQHTTTFCNKEQQYFGKKNTTATFQRKQYSIILRKRPQHLRRNDTPTFGKGNFTEHTHRKTYFCMFRNVMFSKTVAVISEMSLFDTQGRCICEGPRRGCKNWPPVEFILKTKEAGAFQ